MSVKLSPGEVKALNDEFAELIRREPLCSLDTIFDEIARRRVGMAISRLTEHQRLTGK
jgi:hypothetical protein